MELTTSDVSCFEHAVRLAVEAEQQGNLPRASVMSLQGDIIAEGQNAIWSPKFNQNRHVVFGSADHYGRAGMVMGHMPPFFEEVASQNQWLGPAHTEGCDPLFARVIQLVEKRRKTWP